MTDLDRPDENASEITSETASEMASEGAAEMASEAAYEAAPETPSEAAQFAMSGLLRIVARRRRMIDRTLRVAFIVVLVLFTLFRPVEAGDAHAYWAVDLEDPYSRPVATPDAFTYPPPAALLFGAIGRAGGVVPFEVFQAGWTLLIGLALLWLTGPWALAFLVIPVVASDLYLGNIHLLLAAAIVASLRWPALWAVPLLTKPTCGVGLLWFVARGEWRRLATALAATGAIVLASAIVAPALWPRWIEYVLGTGVSPDTGTAWAIPLPLLLRLPAAALLVVWGARTNRPWTLPTAAMLALPVLWFVGLAMIAGAFALSAWGPLRGFARRWASAPETGAAGSPGGDAVAQLGALAARLGALAARLGALAARLGDGRHR